MLSEPEARRARQSKPGSTSSPARSSSRRRRRWPAGRACCVSFARLPNCATYCSATRSWTASKPPGSLIASATRRMPSAVAVATDEDRRRLPFRLVDLLLLARFRRLDDLLLLAFRVVDGGVARAFRRQDDGALLALGAHLLFHRRQHVVRRRDVLDLVAQHLDAPRLRRLVELGDDLRVDVGALLERAVEIDLADLAAQRRLRQLRDREA